jgi:ferredoxin
MSKISKIEIDSALCIGDGTCEIIATKTFKLNSEGKSTVIKPWADDEEEITRAAQSCPVLAIKLFDEIGKQIFP